MQINFYANKESIIELTEWIKEKFNNLLFYDSYEKKFMNKQVIYQQDIGFCRKFILTDKNSVFAEKLKSNDFSFLDEQYPFIWKSGIEFLIGYSDSKIYNFDFSSYNPYDKNNNEQFYLCRVYLDSYYLSNSLYSNIYKKICEKIRKHSTKINGNYVKDYLFNMDSK